MQQECSEEKHLSLSAPFSGSDYLKVERLGFGCGVSLTSLKKDLADFSFSWNLPFSPVSQLNSGPLSHASGFLHTTVMNVAFTMKYILKYQIVKPRGKKSPEWLACKPWKFRKHWVL